MRERKREKLIGCNGLVEGVFLLLLRHDGDELRGHAIQGGSGGLLGERNCIIIARAAHMIGGMEA